VNSMADKLKAFERLLHVMDDLREGCPWDMKQTMETLRHLTIEETYELGDAILEGDMEEIKKELGDVMLHLVFYSRIASETQHFDIADVLNSICEKLISRHPHIYGDPEKSGELVKVANAEEVKQNWEALKLKEGKTSVLEGVPKSLPAMVKATRIQDKARGVGFDWEHPEQVWEKVQEEMHEFKEAVEEGDADQIENEFGDILFSLINYARFKDIDPELALERTNKKFIKRFQYLESEATKAGKKLHDMTLAEMDVHWNAAKKM